MKRRWRVFAWGSLAWVMGSMVTPRASAHPCLLALLDGVKAPQSVFFPSKFYSDYPGFSFDKKLKQFSSLSFPTQKRVLLGGIKNVMSAKGIARYESGQDDPFHQLLQLWTQSQIPALLQRELVFDFIQSVDHAPFSSALFRTKATVELINALPTGSNPTLVYVLKQSFYEHLERASLAWLTGQWASLYQIIESSLYAEPFLATSPSSQREWFLKRLRLVRYIKGVLEEIEKRAALSSSFPFPLEDFRTSVKRAEASLKLSLIPLMSESGLWSEALLQAREVRSLGLQDGSSQAIHFLQAVSILTLGQSHPDSPQAFREALSSTLGDLNSPHLARQQVIGERLSPLFERLRETYRWVATAKGIVCFDKKTGHRVARSQLNVFSEKLTTKVQIELSPSFLAQSQELLQLLVGLTTLLRPLGEEFEFVLSKDDAKRYPFALKTHGTWGMRSFESLWKENFKDTELGRALVAFDPSLKLLSCKYDAHPTVTVQLPLLEED